MPKFFFYGTLRHAPLLEVVLNRPVRGHHAWIDDHATHWVQGERFPMISAEPGARAEGLLVEGLSAQDVARLDFYEGGFGYQTRDLPVATEACDGSATARVYFPAPGQWRAGRPFRLGEWEACCAEVVVEAARDFMRTFGRRSSQEMITRYPMMLTRAGSRLRARPGRPTSLRRTALPGDVAIEQHREPYAGFFSVEEADLRFRAFSGGLVGPVTRAAFVQGDSVTVLPYDPQRDRVLVVEQFRMGPFARGDAQPWSIEAVAGRVDGYETPQEAARREASEEAGIELHDLIAVADYYPSPGAATEFIYSFIALADLPDTASRLGGVESEAEDIRAHVIGFERLMALINSGEAASGPLIVTAFWLARNRAALRRGA